jgi:hypothetical protein
MFFWGYLYKWIIDWNKKEELMGIVGCLTESGKLDQKEGLILPWIASKFYVLQLQIFKEISNQFMMQSGLISRLPDP